MAYITEAEADTLLASKGVAWSAKTSAEKLVAIETAQIYLDARYDWPGVIADATTPQADNWPRTSTTGGTLVDAENRPLTGVPELVKRATAEAAYISLTSSILPSDVATVGSVTSSVPAGTLTKKRTKVGSLDIEENYSAGGTTTETTKTAAVLDDNNLPIIALIDALLRPIIDIGTTTTTSNNYYISRA